MASGLGSNANNANFFFVNTTTLSQSFTIPDNCNALTAGPVTLAAGVTVTVPTGSVWTIV